MKRIVLAALPLALATACGAPAPEAGTPAAEAPARSTPVAVSVSGLKASSGRSVKLARLERGTRVYVDRRYELTDVPLGLEGAVLLQTSNADKKLEADEAYRFKVGADADVWVAYDVRAKVLPNWLLSWDAVEGQLGTSDVPRRLFKRRFPAGDTVVIGGNWQGAAHGAESNLNIFVTPAR
jgi:hypothetical protein